MDGFWNTNSKLNDECFTYFPQHSTESFPSNERFFSSDWKIDWSPTLAKLAIPIHLKMTMLLTGYL